MNFKQFTEQLESKIQRSYEVGVTLIEAEPLAAEFLHGQLMVSSELRKLDLDSRMKKAGLKAVKAAAYMEAAKSDTKKPTEAAISAMIDTDETVQAVQDQLDMAEAERDDLTRLYNIFREAHIFFRGISKGKFD